jgi:hypothetical protein
MTEPDDDFDSQLRRQLQGAAEPDDAGFSLRVMAALSPPEALDHRRWARAVRCVQWTAASLAACGAATLLSGAYPLDLPHTTAAATLLLLLTFWVIPSRWSRG